MDHGPVVSRIYNLIRDEPDPHPKLRRIDPWHVFNCFRQFDANSPFTKALITIPDAPEFEDIEFRNVFLHRLNPGRTIRLMVDKHSVNSTDDGLPG
jgi:hypothetical protein